MKAIPWFSFLLLVIVCAGCAHPGKIAAKLYVPTRCIRKVAWTRPCASISEHMLKCDGVMVTTSCVSVHNDHGRKLEPKDYAAN